MYQIVLKIYFNDGSSLKISQEEHVVENEPEIEPEIELWSDAEEQASDNCDDLLILFIPKS